MSEYNQNAYRFRLDFGKLQKLVDIPPLLGIQVDSFKKFLQLETEDPRERENFGLEAALRDIFPITDNGGYFYMEYMYYNLGEPKFDQQECRSRGITYALPLRVMLRLTQYDKEAGVDKDDIKKIKEIKEQEVYFGDFPVMTERGSFIVNGTERVIVSQLHRSPGVIFEYRPSKSVKNINIFSAQIIPQRGSWINFEIDHKELFNISFDKKQKLRGTVFLKALGFSDEDILRRFYIHETIDLTKATNSDPDKKTFYKLVDSKSMLNQKASANIIDPKTKKVIVNKGNKINKNHFKKLEELKFKKVEIDLDHIIGRPLLESIKLSNGQEIASSNQIVTEELLEELIEAKIENIKLIFYGNRTIGPILRDTLAIDAIQLGDEAVLEVYKKIRPGDLPLIEVAKNQLFNMFFNPDKYDLSSVGRMKLNRKLGLSTDLSLKVLNYEDILEVVSYLLYLKEGIGEIDDIDHLSNRRVKTASELIEVRFRTGFARMEKVISERLSLSSDDGIDINSLVNPKPLLAVINEFFGSSQLSQYMDQTNPLSEVTHKRKLSALGPGGLNRDHAGFDVRDVHNSHYGKICPIETPEGANIGLISAFTCFAKINEHGFIETPYRKVIDSKVSEEVRYLSAFEEDDSKIVQPLVTGKKKIIEDEFVSARVNGDFVTIQNSEVEYMDVAPNQTVSVAASLIPFLEHDDANRALMGSNMQRQAVPVIKPESPLVGTGMEYFVARDSGTCVIARHDGIVDSVDSSRIVIEIDTENDDLKDELNVEIYHLNKYNRTNQNTCINNRPIVKPGQKVKKGQIIADGSSTESGELALGQNMLVAFMPWNGYNYEDSILVSERVLSDDRFTSVHIEELDCLARDTKLGKEQITADLPNVSEYLLRNLDASGIIRVGSYVKTGDILVGKVTPKGESMVNPEDRLLRAIFGDKAGDVRDTSLKVPQGIEGVVIDVKMYNRRGVEKDERLREKEAINLKKIDEDFIDEIRIIKKQFTKKILPLISGSKIKSNILNKRDQSVIFKKNTILTAEDLYLMPEESWEYIQIVGGKEVNRRIAIICKNAYKQFEILNTHYNSKILRETRVDDLPPGVIRTVKVYIAIKRCLSVGDKMAGRHGNKGVISRIIPVEDMPYTADGKPIDIVLNPLGVPSRMNIGQVLECHLGLIAHELGEKIANMFKEGEELSKIKDFVLKIYNSPQAEKRINSMSEKELEEFCVKLTKGVNVSTPVFDGAAESDINRLFDLVGLEHHGKLQLYDGLSGEPFQQKVTVGYMYMLKLHHLVDEKIHARSIGPYSLVTQQPLGGKAQRGGQRFGEMEVWALEAYGAAYTLREMITVKSDDVSGRNLMYESIVKGTNNDYAGMPEAFKVLVNELKSLCIDIKMIKDVRSLEL